jgi:FkbM family methyltransferase
MRLIRKAVKQLLRRAGVDIRFIPELGFDALDDMRKLAGTDAPLILDVGANRGQSIERFRRAFPGSVIHAFEPDRAAFAELERRCGHLPGVHLNHLALGARPEQRTFLHNSRDDMSSFLQPSVDAWGEVTDRYPVEVITADDYCAARGIERLDILKSDTQGFDLAVLQGAQRLLERRAVRLVFMEITFSKMYEELPRFDQIYAFLLDRGFALVSFYDFYYQRERAGWTDALFRLDIDVQS